MRFVNLTAVALLALGVASCGPKSTFTLNGDITLRPATNTWDAMQPCSGEGGYSDITAGAQVTVTDRTGATVALGSLGDGDAASQAGACVFAITVPHVPAGAGFYGVEVTHRGKTQVSEDEAKRGAVHLALTS